MEIRTLLSEALSPDQTRRNQAEEQINQIASLHFGAFIIACSQELSNEKNQKGIRQIAATLLKNMICFTERYKGMWQALDANSKIQVKQHVLSTLASAEKEVRKAAAFTVAGICKVELPMGEWLDIIDILCQTSQNENKYIQLSSVTTLGYIAQELELKDLNEVSVGKVLSSFYTLLNSSNDEEMLENALTGLLNYLPFTKMFFENAEQKSLLLTLFLNFCNHQLPKLRSLAVLCLLEVGRNYYDYIEDWMAQIHSVLKLIMINDTGAGTLAYEFWCSIGEIEITRIQIKKLNYPCKNYCNKYYKELLETIFIHLQLITGKSEESWSITKSASCLLSILSQCCEYNLIQEVVNYIGKNLQQNNYLLKESAILAFGGILDTSHRQNMSVLVINSIETLVGFLCEQNEVVSLKETAAWVIQKIAHNYTLELSKNVDLFDKLIITLISLLKTNSRKVVCYLTDSFHYFATSLKPNDGQNSNILSKHIKNLLNILLEIAFTPNSYNSEDNVAQSCFFTMASIIENSCPDTRQIVHSFFNDLVAGFKSSLNPEFFPNQKMRFDYQAYIAATIEPCLVTGYVNINFEEAKEIMNIVITTFKERGCVYEEGLIAASSVGLSLKEDFDILVKEFGSYLIYALNQISDNSLCKTAIHSTSDLIRSIGNKFSQYLDQILPIILQILASTEADKNLKPHCFNVISDVFLTCKESISPYFKDIMNLISSALEAATFVPDDKDDFENYDYFESLREHILECLICIFQTVVDIQKFNEFREFVPNIVNFIHKINSNNSSPTTEILKRSLEILGDFCEIYKKDMKSLINIDIVEELIKKLKLLKNKKIEIVLTWARKVIGEAVK